MSLKKPSRTASLKNNKESIADLEAIIGAINEGKLDTIFSLHTYTDTDKRRIVTFADIDGQIKHSRESARESVIFAIDAIKKYSSFLRKNFNMSSRDYGYEEDFIWTNINQETFEKMLNTIEFHRKEMKSQFPEMYDYQINIKTFEKIRQRAQEHLDAA